MSVDIIIPIYNAYDDLQICLESVYKNTDLTKHRLVLINDNSPDERIKPYLNEQKERTGNIVIIHNENNKGFSNNINLGMAQSEKNDVILLNSDTIVTSNWVEKMVACAYSSESIGTVTPLSNNATLCSVPNFCEENVLPDGMSVEQAAAIVEECSMKKYPRITVAHGFCMLVKREVIHLIGNFDAETFGRGYGEENDFCNRAEQMGYIHVMCDDTYIYHSGTKSFVSKEKEAYIREHEHILYKRYPEQMHNNAIHCRDNPNAFVGENIRVHFDIRNGKKNILYLLQADFKEGAEDNVGGTQLHVKHLAMELRQTMNVFVAARDREFLQVTAYIEEKEHVFRFPIGKKETFPIFRSRELAEVFRLILNGFKIDLVHVHHTATTSLDIYYEANKMGIPVIYTAHDFYYVCPTIKMLREDGTFCKGKTDNACKKCLQHHCGLYEKNDYIAHWRRQHGKVLQMCRAIIAPTESTKEILRNYYPAIIEKVRVIEHGMDKPEIIQIDESKVVYTKELVWELENFHSKGMCQSLVGVAYFRNEPEFRRRVILKLTDNQGHTIYMPTNYDDNLDTLTKVNRFYCYFPNDILSSGDVVAEVILEKDNKYYMCEDGEKILNKVHFLHEGKFKVAFIGGISEEKGGKAIAEIIKDGPNDVEWYVFGGIGEESLAQLKKDNLVKTGYYYQQDLATHLKYHKIDAICILSKWPETFSYTLSEALLNQVPVIVTDIGALGQRVKNEGVGEVVSVDEKETVKETINIISEWKRRTTEYQKVLECVEGSEHTMVEQMLLNYRELYEVAFLEKEGQYHVLTSVDYEKVFCSYNNALNGYQEKQAILMKVDELESRLKMIDNSVTYKIVRRVAQIPIPFKHKIREIIKNK